MSSTKHVCSYFSTFIPGFNDAMLFNARRRPRRQRGACGDFVNLEICRLSPSEMLIGVGFTYVCSYG